MRCNFSFRVHWPNHTLKSLQENKHEMMQESGYAMHFYLEFTFGLFTS